MTKQVLITIEGRQINGDEEPIIITAPGTYHFTNGRHYIQYDEKLEESETVSKNTIKIGTSKVVLVKKLLQISEMVFDLNEITQTVYQTPYGNLVFDVKTYSILLKEGAEKIEVFMEYSLSADSALVSDNSITVTVTPLS